MFTYYSIVFMTNIKLCLLKSTIELELKAAVVIIKNDDNSLAKSRQTWEYNIL